MIVLLPHVGQELIQVAQLGLPDLGQHTHEVLLRIEAVPL